ncbi:hypothetical protein Tco_1111159 [Tanacetum coccineum]|uniref:Uncharacterized protein n=1 Tax=Tanacetum coccineum TaxID=301880 RepID=A0ABQ5IKT8_9ASTR
MGMWYPKDSGFVLKAFADADYAGCHDTRRSTSGSAQFLGHHDVCSNPLVSRTPRLWNCVHKIDVCEIQSASALCCNSVQSAFKAIDIVSKTSSKSRGSALPHLLMLGNKQMSTETPRETTGCVWSLFEGETKLNHVKEDCSIIPVLTRCVPPGYSYECLAGLGLRHSEWVP